MGDGRRDLAGKLLGLPDIVAVEEGQQLPSGLPDGRIAGSRYALVDLSDVNKTISIGRNTFRCVVGRAVVHDDYLVGRPGLGEDAVERGPDIRGLVVGRDDDADARRLAHQGLSGAMNLDRVFTVGG